MERVCTHCEYPHAAGFGLTTCRDWMLNASIAAAQETGWWVEQGGAGSGWKESCGQADGKIVEEVESSFEGIFKVHATILADSGVKRQTSNWMAPESSCSCHKRQVAEDGKMRRGCCCSSLFMASANNAICCWLWQRQKKRQRQLLLLLLGLLLEAVASFDKTFMRHLALPLLN